MTVSVMDGMASGSSRPWRAVNRVFRRRRVGLFSLMSPPLAWMLLIYVGSLVMLIVAAMFKIDDFTQQPTSEFTTQNFVDTITTWKVIRLFATTVGTAVLVTVICTAIAVPAAFFIAKVAPKWLRRGLMVGMILPLWAGYLVKAYAWRAMVAPAGGNRFAAEGRGGGGFLQSALDWTPGYTRTSAIIALVYLWLPYMMLPVYAGLDRMPTSLLDASSDLGAKAGRTFRSVVFPMLLPSIAAGSIFTFSLTLGDYISPRIVTNGSLDDRIMFGELISATYGAPNQPLAAAYTLLPLVIIVAYLFAMKAAGAFENL